MGGWGRQNLNVTPSGKVLPCHAAETITSLSFDCVTELPLAEIWYHSAAFNAFRGTDWMPEPCRSCERRTVDFGGCRCQAFAIAGRANVTDPACSLSPLHGELVETARAAAAGSSPNFVYRRFGNVGAAAGAATPELADARANAWRSARASPPSSSTSTAACCCTGAGSATAGPRSVAMSSRAKR
jgi:pyrroloquinoline quinone biosynthesis protein E